MARTESSQQIDLQQGTVYSLEMKWLEHTQKKKKKVCCDTVLYISSTGI